MDFLLGMIGARPTEWIAVALGFANITLLIRRSIWNYPFGIAMVSLYGWIFFDARLYGQAALQIIYFAVQVYGWAHWLTRRGDDGRVIVQSLGLKAMTGVVALVALGAILFGILMEQYTDAAAPYADGVVAAIFVAAQLLLARRFLQNWMFWIVGDVFAILLYWSQDLHPTAALYVIFLVLSTLGFFEWRRAYASNRTAP